MAVKFIHGSDDGLNVAISVEGLQGLRKDLMLLEPRLNYKLAARLRRVGNKVATDARGLAGGLADIRGQGSRPSPLAEAAGEVASGISVRTRNRAKSDAVVQIVQSDPTGALVEFADAGHSPQGYALVRMLDRHFGSTGRFVWEATDRNRQFIFVSVAQEVAKTEAELNSKIGGSA